MPLSNFMNVDDIQIYVWKISESPEELAALLGNQSFYRQVQQKFKPLSRQQEAMIEQILIEKHFNSHEVVLSHKQNGMPYVRNRLSNISISHTKGWVAVAFSEKSHYGIDIETILSRHRVDGISEYFMTSREMPVNAQALPLYKLVLWCAKESIFKSQMDGVANHMKDFFIPPFVFRPEGNFPAFILSQHGDGKVSVRYFCNQDYILTVAQITSSCGNCDAGEVVGE